MTIVLFIALIVIFLVISGNQSKKLNQTYELLNHLRRTVEKLSHKIDELSITKPSAKDIETPPVVKPEIIEPKSEVKPEETLSFLETEEEVEPPKANVEESKVEQPEKPKMAFARVLAERKKVNDAEKEKALVLSEEIKKIPPRKSFMERNPDLEKFVGENLINKIGIAILVLGIGFFVKFAIDQNWINEVARVGIGLLCGGVLLGIAHKLRNTFQAFSSVLVGGGIAVLYFTIAIAFHEYQIIGSTAAFFIMIGITAFAVFLALAYDRIELAILSLLGGFATPFIASSGEGNYIVLFTYLCILNVGMLVLANFKKWNLINIISYGLTILIFGNWVALQALQMDFPPYKDILLFASLFFIIFFLMNIINNVRSDRKFSGIEIGILISNNFLYYAVGMVVLKELGDGQYQGLFTALLGLINFVFAYFLFKKEKVDQNLVYLLIGMVMTFVSLAGPVQLEGNYITLFWAAEAVLLLWLSIKSGIKIMGYASILINVLMLGSLAMDWLQIYMDNKEGFNVILNKGFITGLFMLASLLLTRMLLSKNKELDLFEFLTVQSSRNEVAGVNSFPYSNIIAGLVLVTAYLVGLFEFNFQLDQRIASYPVRSVILASYHFAFFIAVYAIGKNRASNGLKYTSIVLLIIGMLSYILFYNAHVIELRNAFILITENVVFGFMYHYFNLILVAVMAIAFFQAIKNIEQLSKENRSWIFAGLSIYTLFVLSMELDHLVSWISFQPGRSIPNIIEQNHKIGFPVLWGLFSFGLMWLGMKYKSKYLRIVALFILLVTLVKLFVYDIRDVSEAGKIVAFICLGILLLVISFMYQKLKKLIISDEEKKNE